MKTKWFVLLLSAAGLFTGLNAQLSGSYSIPGSYATVAAAVSALNAAGVGTGGVTFNVAANHTETLSGRIDLTVTGLASRPIVFQKSGTGANPLITAYTGISEDANTPDGIWSLSGCDYVTINGIDLYDPNTASTITMMEYGFGLFLSSTIYGAQYNTIKNCVITLNRNNECYSTLTQSKGSAGILAVNAFTATAQSEVYPPSMGVTNSYNKFHTNRIENCSIGILLKGYNSGVPIVAVDRNNDIGGTGTATGNQILNFGGGNTTHPAVGIKAKYQWDANIAYNTVNNNNGSGINHTNTLYGIEFIVSLNSNITVSQNNISLKSGSAASYTYGIYSQGGSALLYNTVNISGNRITDCAYDSVGTGGFTAILNNGDMGTINITRNTVANCTQAARGAFRGIYNTEGQVINISENIIRNNTFTGDYGSMHLIQLRSTNNNVTGNQIYDNAAFPTSVDNGTIIGGIYFDLPANSDAGTYSGNSIYNLSISGAGKAPYSTINGIQLASADTSAVKQISGNLIYGFTYNTGRSTSMTGIGVNYGQPEIARNKIHGFTADGNSNIRGINSYLAVAQIHNNMIYDLNTVNASQQPSTTAINCYGQCHVSYNTVYLNAIGVHSSFSNTALYLYTATARAYLRNNIFVNKSVPGAAGKVAAVWCAYTDTETVGAGSDNNIYYAGTPDARHLIGVFAWNYYQTLAAYQALWADREQNTATEDVPFVSTSGIIDLHINPSLFTLAEGNAVPVTGITTDFDNQTRNALTPDIGADEGEFEDILLNDLAVLSMTSWTLGFPGGNNSHTIEIKNPGTTLFNSYTVRLMSSAGPTELVTLNVTSPLYPQDTVEHTLNWIPALAGTYQVYGEVVADPDDNSTNDASSVRQVNIYEWTTYSAIVGNQESTLTFESLPLCFGAKNSLSETIYTATEMQMQSGTIEGIAYYSNFTQELFQKPVKVWMKNTTADDLSSGWLDWAGYTLVFDGLLDFRTGEYSIVHVPLASPFAYTGENLALRVSRPMDTVFYEDFSTAFYYSPPMYADHRSRYLASNSIEYNPESPSSAGTLTSWIPLTVFIAPVSVPVVLTPPIVSISSSGTDIILDWDPVPGAYCYRIYESDDPYSWDSFPDSVVYAESYVYSSLSAGKKYFRVIAVSTYW